jgi:hypothetical protein
MRIPMKGAVGSLNAAVAGSILLFEALAQRDGTSVAPRPQATETAAAAPPPEPPPAARPKTRGRTKTTPPVETLPDGSADDLLPGDAAPKPKARARRTKDEGA